MTEIQVKALHQWFGEEWESVVKLSWRAMAEELLGLQQPTYPEFGASQAAARKALREVQEGKMLEEGKMIEDGYEPLDEAFEEGETIGLMMGARAELPELDEDGFYVVPF